MLTTPDDYTRAALAVLTHRDECPQPPVGTFIGWRGDEMARCRTCGATAPLARLLEQIDTEAQPERPRGRYRLDCCRCDRAIYLDNPRPRIPLCAICARSNRKNTA